MIIRPIYIQYNQLISLPIACRSTMMIFVFEILYI